MMPYPLRSTATFLASLVVLINAAEPAACQSAKNPLELEAKISLGDVSGRIDHMAVDLRRQRLFVAELGNDSVGVVDIANRTLMRRITGLREPQGVGYEPTTDTLFVANARDGSVQLFDGNDYKIAGRIELGNDADNVRIDAATKRVVVGYGGGALAILDPQTRSKVGDVPLKAHPESFQIDSESGRIFVNLPGAHAVTVVDRNSEKPVATWPMDQGANFAMALDRARGLVLLVFRTSSRLAAFAIADGKPVSSVETCGDVDDLFVDPKRGRLYVSCGAGFVDVFEANGSANQRIAHVPTVGGARTSLFVPEIDRLFVAVRAKAAEPAAIWVFRPAL
jgi:DNA-binding beta-propeller fold protein YncE